MMGPGPVMAPPPSDGRRGEGEDEADPDDDGSGNDNRMIPLFRGMMKKYGAGLLVCSVGFLVILIIEAAALWNMRPSWIKKVPCVLQPKLARVESTLKGIERYFLLSGMVPPAATCVFILVHLIASRARTDRDYEPPSARWMILIWSWKILTPLVVYVFIQVKADQFVGYEAMAQKLCEVSLSLTLYPPGSATLEKAAGSLSTGFLNSFSTSRAFTNLRNASRLYFSDDKNYLFPDLAFEVELANLPVSPQNGRRDLDLDDVDGETVLDFLLRRAFDPSKDSWWEEYPNWREPEAATCRQDVPKEVPASTPAPSAPSAPSKAAKVKSWINKTVNDALNCVEGNDADNKVYKAIEKYLEPDAVLVNFCAKGIAAGKKKFGYSAGDAAAWAIGVLTDHLDNIITGFSFSYTFCDADVALKDKFLTVGGVLDRGMSAFAPKPARAEQIKALTQCEWIKNNENWQGEVELGVVDTKEECVSKVRADTQCVSATKGPATIANVDPQEDGEGFTCYCQWGYDTTEWPDVQQETCLLSSIFSQADAEKAADVKLSDVCTNFMAKKTSAASLFPGVLPYLDALGITKQGPKQAGAFFDALNKNAEFVQDRKNVDLCDTHIKNESALELYCMLMGVKDPETNVNALSSLMCPHLVSDLKTAEKTCKSVPDEPARTGTGDMRGRTVSKRAECQVLSANGVSGEKLLDRVILNTASAMVNHRVFMTVLPQNYTSLRTLVSRMAEGVFSTEKENSRVGVAAQPRGFKLPYTLPSGTQLEFFAGTCEGGDRRLEMELLKNVSNIKNGGSRVKPPTLGGKKQAVQAQDLLFRGFDFKTCWEACAAYYPTTVVIDGPELELGADTCTFPFELNGKQFHSCVPKSTLLKVAFDEDAEDDTNEVYCSKVAVATGEDDFIPCPDQCFCQTQCPRRLCNGGTSLAKTSQKITETANCRDQTFLRWLEKFGTGDPKGSMVAAIKYMQELILNEGQAQAKLIKNLVEDEALELFSVLQARILISPKCMYWSTVMYYSIPLPYFYASFVLTMLPIGFPDKITDYEGNIVQVDIPQGSNTFEAKNMLGGKTWGGTCVDSEIESWCTAQMKEWDICYCIRSAEDLFWAIAFGMSPMWAQNPDTQAWSIQPKTKFAPGCRSNGLSACAAKYYVDEEEYGSKRCWYDEDDYAYCARANSSNTSVVRYIQVPDWDEQDWDEFVKEELEPCTCEAYEFPSGDAIAKGVDEFKKFIDQILVDAINSGMVMVLQAAREFAQKITATMASATNKIQYVIGLMIGTQSVIKLVPLALAVLSGVNKGFASYTEMTEKSQVADKHHDLSNLRKSVVMVVATASSVFVLPILVVVIFFFQGFATYYFMVTVLGVALMLGGKIFWLVKNASLREDQKSFVARHGPGGTQVLAILLMIGGAVAWWWTDRKFIENAIGWGGNKVADFFVKQKSMFFYKLIFSSLYNFFYSSLATIIICSRLIGWTFREYHNFFYADGQRSELWKVNIHERSYYNDIRDSPNAKFSMSSSMEEQGQQPYSQPPAPFHPQSPPPSQPLAPPVVYHTSPSLQQMPEGVSWIAGHSGNSYGV